MQHAWARTPLYQQVIFLHKKGLPHSHICAQLNEPRWRVSYMIGKLQRAGLLKKRESNAWKKRTKRAVEDKIVALRSAKFSNRQIAKAVGITTGAVGNHIVKLIKKGRVQPRMPGRIAVPASKALSFWRDPTCPQYQTFVGMVRRKIGRQIIASHFCCTARRVDELKRKIRKRFGDAELAELQQQSA